MRVKIHKHKFNIAIISLILAIIYFIDILQIDEFTGDFYKYERDFNSIEFHSSFDRIFQHYEFGFLFISFLLQKINFTFNMFLFSAALLFYYFIGSLLLRNSYFRSTNFLVYALMLVIFPFYFAYDSLLYVVFRQSLAVIILFAFYFPEEPRGKLYYFTLALIASFFHISAIIFFFIYLSTQTFKKINLYLYLFIFSFCAYIIDLPLYFTENIKEILNTIFPMKKNLIHIYEIKNYQLGFSLKKSIIILFPLIFFIFERKETISNHFKREIWQIYFIISSVGMIMSGIAYYDRVLLYAWILIPILALPFCERIFSNNFNRNYQN